MTLEEIRNAILADATLKQMAIDGRDGDIVKSMTKASTNPQLTLTELMSKLSGTSMARLIDNSVALLDFRDMVNRKDFAGLFFWASAFQKSSDITTSEMNAINAELTRCLPNSVTVTLDEVNKALKPLRTEGKIGISNWLGA